MRYEPTVERRILVAALRDEYGVRAEGLTFLPYGYETACYRVARPADAPLFLKTWPAAPSGGPNGSWRPGTLPLLHALETRGVPIRVAAPLPTRAGGLWADVDGIPLALFPFIEGEHPAWTPRLRDELAATVAAIHRATPALRDQISRHEDFATPRSAPIRAGLAELAGIGAGARPGLRALRDALLPRRDEVVAQLDRLEGLREAVRQLSGPTVLCHTDIGDQNLLVDRDGRLVVLDWDEARVAPPEYDLYELAAQHGVPFLRAYEAAGGSGPLHHDHVALALLSRAVGDMAVRFLGILAGGMTAEAEADALAGIEAWGFECWRRLDLTLAALAPALR